MVVEVMVQRAHALVLAGSAAAVKPGALGIAPRCGENNGVSVTLIFSFRRLVGSLERGPPVAAPAWRPRHRTTQPLDRGPRDGAGGFRSGLRYALWMMHF